jgi:hypothetical protein
MAEHPVAATVTPVWAKESLDTPQPIDRVQETLKVLMRTFLYLTLRLHIHDTYR